MSTFKVFDEQWYLATYPDVAAAVRQGHFASALEHFKQYGIVEGRFPCAAKADRTPTTMAGFDEDLYLAAYSDVAEAVRAGTIASGYVHWLQYGKAEGRGYRTAGNHLRATEIESSRRAWGYLEVADFSGGTATIRGWLLNPIEHFEAIWVILDDQLLGECEMGYRKDIAHHFAKFPHAGLSGFSISQRFEAALDGYVSVIVVGLSAGGHQFVLRQFCLIKPESAGELPPASLKKRVTGQIDDETFINSGADNALQFINVLRKHLTINTPRVLDWGCGSGRIDRHLVRFWPEIDLTGCDIDAEAVQWCKSNLRGSFDVTGPFPPLPYRDGEFDAVIGYSVMTHLPCPLQGRWLAEIRRVLKPGGIFATTVHGTFAANLGFAPDLVQSLEQAGILDEFLDPALDGVAPQGYYRGVYQTPTYTRENWGLHFEIISYIEGTFLAFQDLVVMRRPD
jgi:SAM-dependent methyltransferase